MRDLFGAALALVLFTILSTRLAPVIAHYLDRRVEDVAAEKMAEIDTAAQAYVLNNYQALLTQAAGGNVALTAAALQTAGNLDPDFEDTNAWGQTHVAIVHLYAANQLQLMSATCGGSAIPDGTLVRLALNIPYDGAAILSSASTMASAGQKQQLLAPFSNASCSLTKGHLVAMAYFDNSQIVPPWMDRYAVPGATPANDPNTMHTDMYMGGNNIRAVADVIGANRVNPDSSSVKLSQVPYFSLTTDGGKVKKITGCPLGGAPNAIGWPSGMIVKSGTPENGFWANVVDAGDGVNWLASLDSYSQPASGGSGVTTPVAVGSGNSLIVVMQQCP